ncbi:hypothetical protein AJ79_02071 [Helicocarpus griseus UAMH5409]|uniref:Ubiquitin 3 binding protein But2 C-terminal domain-containing protein n=1 Tax=Helicocarpus griseus UAMH5409 TaxID=1447875 RepID=A0A2B7XVV9_9EURO|nr:hypothetical protein AJ79_02071 [Helicocarpus griseus UAMH5409]
MHFITATPLLLAAFALHSASALPAPSSNDPQVFCVATHRPCKINNKTTCCPINSSTNTPKSNHSEPKTCQPGQSGKVTMPKLIPIVDGNQDPDPISDIFMTKDGESTVAQQITFTLPEGAKGCALGWEVGNEREFTVEGNGYTKIFQDNASESIGGADFTNWPQVGGPHSHDVVSDLECERTMVFEAHLQEDGEVRLVQTKENGWVMEYTC